MIEYCDNCGLEFEIGADEWTERMKLNNDASMFCSEECEKKFQEM